MHIQVPHKSTRAQTITKLKQALEEARSKAKENQIEITEERWEGDVLHFGVTVQGKNITGTLGITETDFVIDAKLPLLWRIFEGKIEKMIAEQAKALS